MRDKSEDTTPALNRGGSGLLETHGLAVTVGGRTLCRDLELALRPGELWGVLGVNGSGKSTLLHTLAGLRPAADGEVRLDGTPLTALSRRAVARRLGLLLQESRDAFPATVLEICLAGRHPHLSAWQTEGPQERAAARAALADLGLTGLEARLVSTLSGGERRRLALATLLLQDPAVMLLDEPTNHLDLHHQMGLLHRLRQLADGGKGILAVLHDPGVARRFCDRLLLLDGDGGSETLSAEALDGERVGHLYRHEMITVAGPFGPLYVPR